MESMYTVVVVVSDPSTSTSSHSALNNSVNLKVDLDIAKNTTTTPY